MVVSPYVFVGLKYNYLTEEQRKELFRTLPPYKLAQLIKESVAKYFNIPVEEMEGKSQKSVLPWSRQVFCFLAKELTHLADKELGVFINRDRSTVCTHIKQVKQNMNTYREYLDQIADLRLLIKNNISDSMYTGIKESIK